MAPVDPQAPLRKGSLHINTADNCHQESLLIVNTEIMAFHNSHHLKMEQTHPNSNQKIPELLSQRTGQITSMYKY